MEIKSTGSKCGRQDIPSPRSCGLMALRTENTKCLSSAGPKENRIGAGLVARLASVCALDMDMAGRTSAATRSTASSARTPMVNSGEVTFGLKTNDTCRLVG